MTQEEALVQAETFTQQILDSMEGYKEQAILLWAISPVHFYVKCGRSLDDYLDAMNKAEEKGKETLCRIKTQLEQIRTQKAGSET